MPCITFLVSVDTISAPFHGRTQRDRHAEQTEDLLWRVLSRFANQGLLAGCLSEGGARRDHLLLKRSAGEVYRTFGPVPPRPVYPGTTPSSRTIDLAA